LPEIACDTSVLQYLHQFGALRFESPYAKVFGLFVTLLDSILSS